MNSTESGLVQLFKDQAADTPDNAAIVFRGEQISYAQLDRETDALGAYLRRCGVSTDDPVGNIHGYLPGVHRGKHRDFEGRRRLYANVP